MSGPPLMKRGSFECASLRAFQKKQHCAAPGCDRAADDPHHFPSVGAGGDDLGIIPTCRPHHRLMQSYALPFTPQWQTEAAAAALVAFLRRANELERKAFVAAWGRYVESRIWIEA